MLSLTANYSLFPGYTYIIISEVLIAHHVWHFNTDHSWDLITYYSYGLSINQFWPLTTYIIPEILNIIPEICDVSFLRIYCILFLSSYHTSCLRSFYLSFLRSCYVSVLRFTTYHFWEPNAYMYLCWRLRSMAIHHHYYILVLPCS